MPGRRPTRTERRRRTRFLALSAVAIIGGLAAGVVLMNTRSARAVEANLKELEGQHLAVLSLIDADREELGTHRARLEEIIAAKGGLVGPRFLIRTSTLDDANRALAVASNSHVLVSLLAGDPDAALEDLDRIDRLLSEQPALRKELEMDLRPLRRAVVLLAQAKGSPTWQLLLGQFRSTIRQAAEAEGS